MNISEAAIVASGLSIVRLENQRFVDDVGDIIRRNISQADPIDLVLLARGSHFMRDFPNSKDIYTQVHARALSLYSQKKLESDHIDALSRIFGSHKIINDSPFVESRVQR